MSAASISHSLLARLLPLQVIPVAERPRRRSVAMSVAHQCAVLGERCSLVSRLDEAVDVQSVYSDLRAQAIAGGSAVLNDLGWVWLNGKYWRGDTRLASQLLRLAALQGSAPAYFNLAQQHYFGKGVAVSYIEAAQCYRRAFECGSAYAAAALGDLYEEEVCDAGHDWRVDLAEAYRWFLRGAERGEPRCRFEVGYRLLHGVQVDIDVGAAVYWLELAAAERVVQAAEELAVHFSDSDGVRYRQWRDRAIGLGSGLGFVRRVEG